LALAFQLQGLTPDLRERGEIRYVFKTEDKEFRSTSKKIAEFSDTSDFVQEFPLADFPPAHYWVQVSLVLDGQELLARSDEFDVTYLEAIARPWVYSRILPNAADPLYVYVTGLQLFNSDKLEEARDNLEKALEAKPDSVDIAFYLARAYMRLSAYEKVEQVLLPFFNKPQAPKYELYFLLGQSYFSRGEWQKVIDLFNQAINHYGVNTSILNLIGESYLRLGKTEEARQAWKKSLEIDPRQPRVQKAIESLKEQR
jgi:tetratricopeptide (TPR) repeat protein